MGNYCGLSVLAWSKNDVIRLVPANERYSGDLARQYLEKIAEELKQRILHRRSNYSINQLLGKCLHHFVVDSLRVQQR